MKKQINIPSVYYLTSDNPIGLLAAQNNGSSRPAMHLDGTAFDVANRKQFLALRRLSAEKTTLKSALNNKAVQ
jgi:hypothetical protein